MYFVERLYKQAEDGTWKYGVYQFSERVAAEKQFYKLLAADIDDETKEIATVTIIDEYGDAVMRKRFDHPKPVPVSGTEPEVEEAN